MRYLVAHVIHSPAGAVRTARLVIEDVPDKTSKAAVIEALTNAAVGKDETPYGVRFSEGGVPFGNHDVIAEGRAGWPKGVAGTEAAKVTTWEKLMIPAPVEDRKRIVVRLSPAGYAAASLAAQQDGISLQAWCERVMLTAANAPASAYLPRASRAGGES